MRHVTNALNALVVATFKMGALRQQLLVIPSLTAGGGIWCGREMRDLLPRGMLLVPLLSSSLAGRGWRFPSTPPHLCIHRQT